MRTHPDIGLVTGDLLQLARFWLCRALANQGRGFDSQHGQAIFQFARCGRTHCFSLMQWQEYALPGQLLLSMSVAGDPSQQQPKTCSLGHLGSNGAIEGKQR